MNINASHTILVVEDDQKISDLLINYLKANQYRGIAAYDGRTALQFAKDETFDAIILDWMLPELNGIQLCQEIRTFSDIPILMLTAKVEEVDRLLGLDTGADDYVCKPFAPREVIARIRALLRRSEGKLIANANPWFVDENAFRIRLKGEWLPLTRVEFLILRLLLSRSGRVFSRDHLLNTIHATQKDISDRAIDTHVKNLRKKIQKIDPNFDDIVSVYGVGYRFDLP